MTDLHDLMTTMLRDEPTLPLVVDTAIREGRQARRRHRIAAVASTCVVVAVVAAIGVVVVRNSNHSPTQLSSGSTTARCDTPDRAVPDLLDWPCMTATPTGYDQQQISQTLTLAAILWPTDVNEADLQIRVLGFGPLPNSRPGTSLVYAEVWERSGTTPARIIYSVTAPVHYFGRAAVRNAALHGLGPNDPEVPGGGTGDTTSGGSGLFVALTVEFKHPEPRDACEAMLNTPVPPKTAYPSACTDTVIARPDIAAIRIVHANGDVDQPIPVVNGLAGINYPNEYRHGWTIQGLDSAGDVVATVPYHLSH